LVFTAEEVWKTRKGDQAISVHERVFPEVPENWRDQQLAGRWQVIRKVRRVVTGALEVDRRDKVIGSSLAAGVTIYIEDNTFKSALEGADFMEICITSGAKVLFKAAPENAFRLDDVNGVAVVTAKADGEKCERCWMVLDEVGKSEKYNDLCNRCSEVVAALLEAPEGS